MTAHMYEVVDSCLVWQSRQHSVAHVTLCILSSISTTCYSLHSPCFTGDALNLPAVLAGAVVAFLLLTLLIAGIIVGALLLRRRAHKKRMLSQQKGGITKSSKAAKEEEGTEVHTYDVVGDDTTIDGRVAMYQELNTGNLDYVSEYTQLRGGTYQELDLKSREEEHHYQQKAN